MRLVVVERNRAHSASIALRKALGCCGCAAPSPPSEPIGAARLIDQLSGIEIPSSVAVAPVADFAPNPWNRNKMDDFMREKLARSIRKDGFLIPVLVRIMNTYYSNLIEGHDTRPRYIERALVGELDRAGGRRNLRLEAKAHKPVQEQVDCIAAEGQLPEPASREFVRWLRREFYRDAPEAMLRIRGAGREVKMEPGDWRSRPQNMTLRWACIGLPRASA